MPLIAALHSKSWPLPGLWRPVAAALLALGLAATGLPAVSAQAPEAQREDYLLARQALKQGRHQTFQRIAGGLKDYPLYPYLRHAALRKRFGAARDAEFIEFLSRYPDLPVTPGLRAAWLKRLAERRQWQMLLTHYTPQSDPVLQCHHLRARMRAGQRAGLPEAIRAVWLAGRSLPPECDPAFAVLYQSALMNDALLWARIRLAMQNNEAGLAAYLARRLKAPAYQQRARAWIAIHHQPERGTARPGLKDDADNRAILLHGLARLARRDVGQAARRLAELKARYEFSAGAMAALNKTLALQAARANSPLAVELLDRLGQQQIDEAVFYYRLRAALAGLPRQTDPDWPLLRRWTEGAPPAAVYAPRWRYWQARALQETGAAAEAGAIFAELAEARDYYGFLAADRIKRPYQMNHAPLPADPAALARLAALPAMRRAREFLLLDMQGPARREWRHALGRMTEAEMQTAASLARRWGWHGQVIQSLSRAGAYDDLALRFPLVYQDLLDQYAARHRLDRGWLYGLVRAESAFIEEAESPAGALGLMQVLPATGRMIARRLGLKNFKPRQLRRAETNIPLGSAYLRQMLDRFDGSLLLATAAYNAGPGRVARWRPAACMEPDLWIARIPFRETREYVRRVFYFAHIYDWRLQSGGPPLSQRLAFTGDKPGAGCAAFKVAGRPHAD